MLGLSSGLFYSNLMSSGPNFSNNTKGLRFDIIDDDDNGIPDFGTPQGTVIVDDDDVLSFSGTGNADDIDFSVACWVKRDDTSSSGFFRKDVLGYDTEYRAFYQSNSLFVDIFDGNGTSASNYRRQVYASNSTDWHHVIIVFNGPGGGVLDADVYFDSVLQSSTGVGGSDTNGMTPGDGNLKIGELNSGYSNEGNMCHFTMWGDYALSADEAVYLYAGGSGYKNPLVSDGDYNGGDNVVLWLPFDGSLNDNSSNSIGTSFTGELTFTTDVPI